MTIHPAIKQTPAAWQAGTADHDGYGFELRSRHSLTRSGKAAAHRAAKMHAKQAAGGDSIGALVIIEETGP